MSVEYNITIFDNITQRQGRKITSKIETIIKALTSPIHKSIEDKSKLPLWSPTTFDGTRSTKNAQSISMIVYDLDDGDTGWESWVLFAQKGWTTLAHTSASHHPSHPKYRVILPLAKPLPKDDWEKIWRAAFELWVNVVQIGIPDQKAIKDMARVYFRYGWPMESKYDGGPWPISHPCHPSKYHQSGSWIGTPLDLKYDHIRLPKPKTRLIVDRTRPMTLSNAMMDPQMRESIGIMAGGQRVGEYIKHIQCPSCGRQSVFFSIDPNSLGSTKWPSCNHVNSCGWWGKMEALS